MTRQFALATSLTFALDQITKLAVVHWLDLINVKFIPVIPGFIHFIMAWNEGINFGLLSGLGDYSRWILIVIALVISIAVTWWMRGEPNPRAQIAAGLLVGGAIGNIFDRLIYGAVADFLNITCCGIRNPFSFNVADITIFIGAIGLIIFSTDKKKS